MRRRGWILLGVLCVIWSFPVGGIRAGEDAAGGALPDFRYIGKRHTEETVERALQRVRPLAPAAVVQAETLLGLSLDPERLDLLLQDIPTNRTKTTFMHVRGIDHPILGVYVEPVLRGDFPDDEALLRTLTHEMIHALIRQNIDYDEYARLPDWFQEGPPNHLLGQSLEKMLTHIAVEHKNPYAVLGGFEGDHFAVPEVTGGYFLAELERRLGNEGVRNFVHGVLSGGSVERGLEAVALLDAEMSEDERKQALAELWSGARELGRAALESHAGAVTGAFYECMVLYDEGGRDRGAGAIACFEELIAAHPDSYAGEVSLYWLSKCHFRRREPELSLAALDLFDRCRSNYGLLDNARYFRIRLYEQLGRFEELREACREYLELFPDGQDYAKVQKISQEQ